MESPNSPRLKTKTKNETGEEQSEDHPYNFDMKVIVPGRPNSQFHILL
jgi:hypothetical protein